MLNHFINYLQNGYYVAEFKSLIKPRAEGLTSLSEAHTGNPKPTQGEVTAREMNKKGKYLS